MPETATLHDQLTAGMHGVLVEMFDIRVGHTMVGDFLLAKDDARVLAKVAEAILRQRVQTLENDLDAATHFLVGPYRVAKHRSEWEVWPDPSLTSVAMPDPPNRYPDRDTALARARELAGL